MSPRVREYGKMDKCWDFSDILMKRRIQDYESVSP
jgi:hypothetical protein